MAAVVLLPSAQARDDRMLFDIRQALDSPLGHDRFDETVAFYWGDQIYPPPMQTFDIHTSERRAFAPTRTDDQACQVAFIEALAGLRDHAKEVGANAVVDIKSIYKNREFRSESQYECRAGYVVTGVALEGRMVKLPAHGISTNRPS
jgi:hypothetical protein